MVDKKKLMDVFEGVNISKKQKENLSEGIVEVISKEAKQYVDFEVEIFSSSEPYAEIKSIFPHTAQKTTIGGSSTLLAFECDNYITFEHEFAHKPVRFKMKDNVHGYTHHGIANVSIANHQIMLVCPVFIDSYMGGKGSEDYIVFKWANSN